MKLATLLSFSTVVMLATACGDDTTATPDGGVVADGGPDTPTVVPQDDSDGDTIPDAIEGAAVERDSDGDGTPDYLDTDSDSDSILDSIEAGDDDPATLPVDSDGDGTPDYLDSDSDDNGLLDAIEGAGDVDGDGVPDFADPDDDGDRIPDTSEIGDGAFPRDTDGDGDPDFRDIDSDGDSIKDETEVDIDTDMDGELDYVDLDSDNDGIPDAVEAGDGDLETPPVDTDMDTIPDYRDLDSDADGLSDALELEAGSSPILVDTDMDGVDDLIEIAAGTDVVDPEDNPRTRGNFVFTVPYREAAEPPRDTLNFRTNVRRADTYFVLDTTGSMSGEISAMKSRLETIIDNITCVDSARACVGDASCEDGEICGLEGTCIEDPADGCIADLWTGVGVYAGEADTYRNLLSLQEDVTVTREAIPGRADGLGGSESLFETTACVADPEACFGALCTSGGVGCPSFRRDAVRILVMITDEDNQCRSEDCRVVNTAGAAGGRLRLQRINFVGIDADSSNSPEDNLRSIGRAAESVDLAGEAFYYEGDGAMVTNAVTTAIGEISSSLQLFVDIEASDVAGDAGDSLQFIQRLEVNLTGEGCSEVSPLADVNSDGFNDAFPQLRTRTPVCWDVVVRPNSRVPPTERPQVFVANLTVFGDGSPLDRRTVFFLVPPQLPEVCPDPPCQ